VTTKGGASNTTSPMGYSLACPTRMRVTSPRRFASASTRASKKASAQLVLSLFAAQQAGAAEALGAPEMLAVRGRTEPLAVLYAVRTA